MPPQTSTYGHTLSLTDALPISSPQSPLPQSSEALSMLKSPISRHTLRALSLMISMPAFGAVSAEQAAQLDQQLTPMGAERAGNTDGSIPGWDGGYKPSTSGGALVDPYAAEQPLQRIDSGNMAQFAQWLSPGTQAIDRKSDV